MRSILAQIDNIAAYDSTVLLIGETGVGKELVSVTNAFDIRFSNGYIY